MDQALPTQFDNTASVWDNIPAFAALQTGQQNAIAQDNNAALQRAFQGEQDFKSQERPITLQNLITSGQHQRAQTGFLNSQTDAENLKNQGTRATQPGSIAVTNSTNKLKQLQDEGELYGQIAAKISDPTMTSWERAATVKRMLGDQLPDHPEINQALLAHADNLPQYFTHISEQARQATNAYKTEKEKETSREKIRQDTNKTNKEIEQMRIDAGKYNKKAAAGKAALTIEETLAKPMAASKRLSLLNDAAAAADQIGESALAASYRARAADQYKQAQAELSAAGGSTVIQPPGGKPQLTNRAGQVNLGGKPKLGTADNPIKLD